jgi:hypothetical protein
MLDRGLAADFLGRHESLEEDLNAALGGAGIKQKIAAPKVNVTPNKDEARDYRSCLLTEDARPRRRTGYQSEIALLGYVVLMATYSNSTEEG